MATFDGFDDPSWRLPEGAEKEILVEAPTFSLDQPRLGDVVTVELEVADGVAAASRTWGLSAGKPLIVANMKLDSLVQTMRAGEKALFRTTGGKESVRLHLVSFELQEDLLGDGTLQRVRFFDGTEREEAVPGYDLELQFAWRPAQADSTTLGGIGADVEESDSTTTVLLAGDPVKRGEASLSKAMMNMRRMLIQRYHGAVVVRGAEEASATAPVVRVSRGSKVLLDTSDGVDVEEAHRRLEAALPFPHAAAWGETQRATVSLEEHGCRCSSAHWLRGLVALRALAGLRAGQRCLLRMGKAHIFGSLSEELVRLGQPEDDLECELEVLQILAVEDITARLCWNTLGVVRKRILRRGEGSCPQEGCRVRFQLCARESSGKELLAEQELELEVACGRICAAVDEALLTMKVGEECEVNCSDESLCQGKSVEMHVSSGSLVVFNLQLLSFEQIDLETLSPSETLEYSTRRKEAGTGFFQEGLRHPQRPNAWYQALRRYKKAAQSLGSAALWPAEEREAALSLRRVCWLNTAACWLKLSAWEEAARCCSEVLAEDPSNPKALFRRGQALSEMSDHEGAEQCAKALLKEDPKSQEAARLLAKARKSLRAAAEQQKGLLTRMAQGIGREPGSVLEVSGGSAPPSSNSTQTAAPVQDIAAAPASSAVWPLWAAAAVTAAAAVICAMAWQRQRSRPR